MYYCHCSRWQRRMHAMFVMAKHFYAKRNFTHQYTCLKCAQFVNQERKTVDRITRSMSQSVQINQEHEIVPRSNCFDFFDKCDNSNQINYRCRIAQTKLRSEVKPRVLHCKGIYIIFFLPNLVVLINKVQRKRNIFRR